MVAVFFSPLHIFVHTFTHPDGVAGDVLCKILTGGNLGWLGGTSSAFTLVAVAVERYYAVNYPHGNKGKLTQGKLKVGRGCDDSSDFFLPDNHADIITLKLIVFSTRKSVGCDFVTNLTPACFPLIRFH